VADYFGETIDIRSPFFARLTGDQRVLAQAVLMRLDTKKGTLWTAPDYGISISDYVELGITADALARIPGDVRAELEKDERIEGAVVTASTTKNPGGGYALVLDIKITPAGGTVFSMTIAVDQLTIQLLTKGA
jgi:phage baseplate assembly protein W